MESQNRQTDKPNKTNNLSFQDSVVSGRRAEPNLSKEKEKYCTIQASKSQGDLTLGMSLTTRLKPFI